MASIAVHEIRDPFVVEDAQQGVFRVNREAFVSPEVLAREHSAIFDKCWLYLGHESELPDPGSFLTRDVGGRELIFARGQDGRARAFFNTCPHRGAMVCREKQGKGKLFRCFYHAWTFDLEGKLVQRPEATRYSENIEPGLHDLVPVAQLAQYRGLYFVTYDPTAVDLETYLAGAREYIDLTVDQSEVGMEIVGGIQEYGFQANWKLLAENSFDGYHGLPTHSTYFDYVVAAGGQMGDINTTISELNQLLQGQPKILTRWQGGRIISRP